MATRSGFFNSVNGDRRYLAGNFAEYFATFIGNGVFPNPSSGLQVVANNNLSVNVKAGKGWINGYYFINDSDAPFTLDVADGVLKRIDRIVFRLDFATRAITLALKKGAFSAAPVAPTLQRDADIYELALADITVNNGATSISQANITDQRMNSAVCGIVQGLVNQVDTTTIYNQYEAWFNQTRDQGELAQQAQLARHEQEFRVWFEGVMDILDGDVAGNLANEISRVETNLDEHVSDYIKHPAVATATFNNNQYTVNIEVTPTILMEGMGVVFLARNDSTGETTLKINTRTAYPILRPNGLPLTNIKANSYYAVRYSLVTRSFMLLGEGGEYGDATPSTVKRGVTFGTEEGVMTGTMPFLADRFIDQTFYRTRTHEIAFTSGTNLGCFSEDERYYFAVNQSSIYRYEISTSTYTNLGGSGFGNNGVTSLFCNDNGTKVFVISGNGIYMNDGTSWTFLDNSATANSQSASSNVDGSEIFFTDVNGIVAKLNTSTKVKTALTTELPSEYKVSWTNDNSVWYRFGSQYKKISSVDGSLKQTHTSSYASRLVWIANRNSADSVQLVVGGRAAVNTTQYFDYYTSDGTMTNFLQTGTVTAGVAASSNGKKLFIKQNPLGIRIYDIGNLVSLQSELSISFNLNTPQHVSSSGQYINNASDFTTIVTYS